MANYDWLKVPGDTLFTSLTKGNQLETRIADLEQHPGSSVTMEQVQETVESLLTTSAPAAINPRGLYVATDSYVKPDIVLGSDGNAYICKATTAVTGLDPTVDTSAWTLFGQRGLQGIQGIPGIQGVPGQNAVADINPKGIWSSKTAYLKDDTVVASDNNAYLCIKSNTGISPILDTSGSWCLFVMQGPQGPKGDPAPAASIGLSALTPALQTEIAASYALAKGSAEGSWGEIDTGKTFRGKKVYRADFTLYVNAAAGATVDFTLNSTPNMVDTIISQGGCWAIGFQTEVHAIPGNIDGTNSSHCLLFGSSNLLIWRSHANNARSGHLALIIVEYTKK